MVKEDHAADGQDGHRGEDGELHALLGAFASYHRASSHPGDVSKSPSVPEGVTVQSRVGVGDARVFSKHTTHEFTVGRWDADELGRAPVVHTYDLIPVAAERLNRELLPASETEEATHDGVVVSNIGGYHSRPDFLKRVAAEETTVTHVDADGDDKKGDTQKQKQKQKPVPAARFLMQLLEGVAQQAGKPVAASVAGKKRKAETGTGNASDKKPKHATITSSWVNVSRPGNRNGLHHHHGALWSGVYYVAVPCEAEGVDGNDAACEKKKSLAGNLVLRVCSGGKNTGGAMSKQSEQARAKPKPPELGDKTDKTDKTGWCVWHAVPPKPGRVVLFPSWIMHGVMSFSGKGKGDGTKNERENKRVSIAFNTGED